jgi:hypothetical protein
VNVECGTGRGMRNGGVTHAVGRPRVYVMRWSLSAGTRGLDYRTRPWLRRGLCGLSLREKRMAPSLRHQSNQSCSKRRCPNFTPALQSLSRLFARARSASAPIGPPPKTSCRIRWSAPYASAANTSEVRTSVRGYFRFYLAYLSPAGGDVGANAMRSRIWRATHAHGRCRAVAALRMRAKGRSAAQRDETWILCPKASARSFDWSTSRSNRIATRRASWAFRSGRS